jgi:hypothetical protein
LVNQKTKAFNSRLALIKLSDQSGTSDVEVQVCALQTGSNMNNMGKVPAVYVNSIDFCSNSTQTSLATSALLTDLNPLKCSFKTVSNNIQANSPLYALIGSNDNIVPNFLSLLKNSKLKKFHIYPPFNFFRLQGFE